MNGFTARTVKNGLVAFLPLFEGEKAGVTNAPSPPLTPPQRGGEYEEDALPPNPHDSVAGGAERRVVEAVPAIHDHLDRRAGEIGWRELSERGVVRRQQHCSGRR